MSQRTLSNNPNLKFEFPNNHQLRTISYPARVSMQVDTWVESQHTYTRNLKVFIYASHPINKWP